MNMKKESLNQNTNNSQKKDSNSHAHNHPHINNNQQVNNKDINDKKDEKNIRKQKILANGFFVPLIIIKIFSSYVLYIKYFCYNLQNETDIKYSQFAITIFALFLYISYFLCIFTSPSQTNVDKYTTLNKEKINSKEIIKLNQKNIICQYCNHVKFNRSSHCRICDKCISYRDHHCLFISNCVGFNNIQYFVNFLFWGSYAIIFDMYAYWTFKYLQLSKTVKIISFIDFCGNMFFLTNIISILLRSILTIYNNRTFLESQRQFHIETKCPIYDFNKKRNSFLENNTFNIGFLSHFYYLIGPSLLHFFLPINKFKTYTLDENCPIFSGTKTPDSIQMLKFKMEDEENFYKEKILGSSNPDDFLKLCHSYYDGKNII